MGDREDTVEQICLGMSRNAHRAARTAWNGKHEYVITMFGLCHIPGCRSWRWKGIRETVVVVEEHFAVLLHVSPPKACSTAVVVVVEVTLINSDAPVYSSARPVQHSSSRATTVVEG